MIFPGNRHQNLKRTAFCAALLLSFCFNLTGEEKEKTPVVTTLHRSASETFTEKVTGMSFSSEIDTFSKVKARSNRNALIGTSISYENEYGSFADVYIYAADPEGKPVTEAQFQEAMNATIRNIETMAEKSKVILKVKRLEDGKFADMDVQPPQSACFCRFRITTQEENVISYLLMCLYKGRIVKIRITYPEDVQSEGKTAMEFSRLLLQSMTTDKKTETTNNK